MPRLRDATAAVLVSKPLPQPQAADSASSTEQGVELYDAPVYKHTSTFSTPDMELTVRSPHVELVVRPGDHNKVKGQVPVFGLRDSIGGTIILNPNTCPASPRAQLVVSIEGALIYSRPSFTRLRRAAAHSTVQRHVFLFSSVVLPLGESTDRAYAHPTSLGQSIRASIRRTIQRSQGKFNKDGLPRSQSMTEVGGKQQDLRPSRTFLFHLPLQHEKEMPPSFKTEPNDDDTVNTSQLPIEDARVEYKITARWESGWLKDMHSQIHGTFIFEPGASGTSFYSVPRPPLEWTETALRSADWESLPFRCVLTLPDPRIFARDSESVFFVGFTTNPPSRQLVSEIQSKAEITVALSCQYWFDSAQEVATTATGKTTKWKQPPTSPLMRLLAKGGVGVGGGGGGSSMLTRANSNSNPIPPLPAEDLIETKQIWSECRTGFPNRLKRRSSTKGGDATDQSAATTSVGDEKRPLPPLGPGPHGLWKGTIKFTQDLMPTMDWSGMTVKYFMSAIVRFGNHELKTDVEVRIVEPHTIRPTRPPRTGKFLGSMDTFHA